MSISLGSTNFGSIYLGSTKIGEAYLGNVKVYSSAPPDPNPLGLPPYTIRLKFTSGTTPSFSNGTAVQVSSSPNVWDLTYQNSDWHNLVKNQPNLIEVLGANTSSVTNMGDMFWDCSALTSVALFDTSAVTGMYYMFYQCSNLTSVPLFDTSAVTSMGSMFWKCSNLTSVPLFDTSAVTDMTYMFYQCKKLKSVPLFDTSAVTRMDKMFYECTRLTSIPLFNTSSSTNVEYMFGGCTFVQSGSLALYQQMSTQSVPPSNHTGCFNDCGWGTDTGLAELQQIPSSWGGWGA